MKLLQGLDLIGEPVAVRTCYDRHEQRLEQARRKRRAVLGFTEHQLMQVRVVMHVRTRSALRGVFKYMGRAQKCSLQTLRSWNRLFFSEQIDGLTATNKH